MFRNFSLRNFISIENGLPGEVPVAQLSITKAKYVGTFFSKYYSSGEDFLQTEATFRDLASLTVAQRTNLVNLLNSVEFATRIQNHFRQRTYSKDFTLLYTDEGAIDFLDRMASAIFASRTLNLLCPMDASQEQVRSFVFRYITELLVGLKIIRIDISVVTPRQISVDDWFAELPILVFNAQHKLFIKAVSSYRVNKEFQGSRISITENEMLSIIHQFGFDVGVVITEGFGTLTHFHQILALVKRYWQSPDLVNKMKLGAGFTTIAHNYNFFMYALGTDYAVNEVVVDPVSNSTTRLSFTYNGVEFISESQLPATIIDSIDTLAEAIKNPIAPYETIPLTDLAKYFKIRDYIDTINDRVLRRVFRRKIRPYQPNARVFRTVSSVQRLAIGIRLYRVRDLAAATASFISDFSHFDADVIKLDELLDGITKSRLNVRHRYMRAELGDVPVQLRRPLAIALAKSIRYMGVGGGITNVGLNGHNFTYTPTDPAFLNQGGVTFISAAANNSMNEYGVRLNGYRGTAIADRFVFFAMRFNLDTRFDKFPWRHMNADTDFRITNTHYITVNHDFILSTCSGVSLTASDYLFNELPFDNQLEVMKSNLIYSTLPVLPGRNFGYYDFQNPPATDVTFTIHGFSYDRTQPRVLTHGRQVDGNYLIPLSVSSVVPSVARYSMLQYLSNSAIPRRDAHLVIDPRTDASIRAFFTSLDEFISPTTVATQPELARVGALVEDMFKQIVRNPLFTSMLDRIANNDVIFDLRSFVPGTISNDVYVYDMIRNNVMSLFTAYLRVYYGLSIVQIRNFVNHIGNAVRYSIFQEFVDKYYEKNVQ